MPDTPFSMTEPIGLIAGNRTLPLLFAQQARKLGPAKVVAVGFDGETDPKLEASVDELIWIKVGQLGKLISAFKERGIRRVVMLGQIAPSNLFNVRPDLKAMAVLLRLKEKNAHTIFGAIAEELDKDGIDLIAATPWLSPVMAPSGVRIGDELSPQESDDVRFGYSIAKEVSRKEIGQLVVVKEGTVLAVEAFEGTDECLRRGGKLAGKNGGAVAVKVAKEKHDMRFDVPCIGPKTIKVCAEGKVRVLAIEADQNLLLEQSEVDRLAKKHGISVLTTRG
jgi:DUF1009 family protein